MKYKLLPLFSLMIISDALGSHEQKAGTYNPYDLLSDSTGTATLRSEVRQKPETSKTAVKNQDTKDEEGWETAGRKKRKNQKDQNVGEKSEKEAEPLPIIRDPILISQPPQRKVEQPVQPPAEFQQETQPVTSDWRSKSYSRGSYYHQYRGRGRGYGRGGWRSYPYSYRGPSYDPYYEGEWRRAFAQDRYVERDSRRLQSQTYSSYPRSPRAKNWRRAFQELNQSYQGEDVAALQAKGGASEIRVIDPEKRIYASVWRPDHKNTATETSTVSANASSPTDAATVRPFPFKATPEIKENPKPVTILDVSRNDTSSSSAYPPAQTFDFRPSPPISKPIATNLSTITDPDEEQE